MSKFRTIHTAYGLQRMAQAEATGVAINLTHMAVGDGNGNPVEPSEAQTFLARERDRRTVNRIFQDDDTPSVFIAEVIIPADVGGFTIREVGIFDDTGALFAVANVPDSYKPLDTEGAFSDTVIRMMFAVTNAAVVTLQIDPNVAVATQTWIVNNVNATTVIPGGLVNQVLSKVSNADGDVEWRDPSATVDVSVSTREETQTLAADQVIVDLVTLTTEGLAVYIAGDRLRADEFTVNTDTRITLAASRPAGTKATLVQNEQTGMSQILFRVNNLSDVPDKAQARQNLGIPNYVATAQIDWGQLANIPAFGTRWPAWGEVSGKPLTFAPSAHRHGWGDLDGVPVYTTRWPSWGEVTGKPGTFTPANHLHPISDITGLQGALDGKANVAGQVFTGAVSAPLFAQSSSRRYKRDIADIDPVVALDLLQRAAFKTYTMRADGSLAAGVIAEDLANGPLDFAVIRTDNGDPEAVNYQPLFVLACAALTGLARRVADLEAKA